MKNIFFERAIAQAARLAGHPARLLRLVAQLGLRISQADRKSYTFSSARNQFHTLGRLVSAYAKGQYRDVSIKTIMVVVAALLYFVNPIDLIPDMVLGVGLTDDLAILTWVIHSLKDELDLFAKWEQSNVRVT